MSARTDVLLWANRVVSRKGSPPHVLLELTEHATPNEVQEAFHRVARTAHPDLHRHGLTPEELELVTTAYAAVASAYQQMRSTVMQTTRMRPIGRDTPTSLPVRTTSTPPSGSRVAPRPGSEPNPTDPRTPRRPGSDVGTSKRAGTDSGPPKPASVSATGSSPPGSLPQPPVPITPSGAAPSANAAQAMSAKALLYYRKAELCLKRGDLKGAILQLKLACAADPSSAFLRTALAEVETEVRKNP
jgi:hypothetical protein